MTDDLLLEATGVAKRYGAVIALRDASLGVRAGEVHALMGANGAGKSTFVKILTGAIRPDAGTIMLRGRERGMHSPDEARRTGLIPVYQEPSLVPDLDVHANLTLTRTPINAFRRWVEDLGVLHLDLRTPARELPLAILRILDLARALAVEPDVLLLDEMTAALPADLTEHVMNAIRRQREAGRSVIFISHRMIEIAAICDRATVLRDGQTVGVVDVTKGTEEQIVKHMLGPIATQPAATRTGTGARSDRLDDAVTARLSVRSLRAGTKLHDVSFDLRVGEVLGIVALEGQGQDELFDVLAGSARPSGGEVHVDGRPARFGHPADAIRAGLVYVPANRAEALLMQRSVRENIALPFSAALNHWGPIDTSTEGRRIGTAVNRLQIDTRAQSEVRRLSGGNQQKVTIARWVAGGVRTLLCFDPTRGIDIRTKREIYDLLRELAAAGAAVLLYTSELEEIPLVCDRVVVIFNGRVVDEMAAAGADEPTLLRAAYGLPPGALTPEEIVAEAAAVEAANAQPDGSRPATMAGVGEPARDTEGTALSPGSRP
ncbi:MAG: sugar ABC transporter ATP-binding protein [Chloroflexi bacterium]|nr:sugar ABC transporter ATP-binding protein [Chloroflexota bacterium]